MLFFRNLLFLILREALYSIALLHAILYLHILNFKLKQLSLFESIKIFRWHPLPLTACYCKSTLSCLVSPLVIIYQIVKHLIILSTRKRKNLRKI
jgi:hypothetical protein